MHRTIKLGLLPSFEINQVIKDCKTYPEVEKLLLQCGKRTLGYSPLLVTAFKQLSSFRKNARNVDPSPVIPHLFFLASKTKFTPKDICSICYYIGIGKLSLQIPSFLISQLDNTKHISPLCISNLLFGLAKLKQSNPVLLNKIASEINNFESWPVDQFAKFSWSFALLSGAPPPVLVDKIASHLLASNEVIPTASTVNLAYLGWSLLEMKSTKFDFVMMKIVKDRFSSRAQAMQKWQGELSHPKPFVAMLTSVCSMTTCPSYVIHPAIEALKLQKEYLPSFSNPDLFLIISSFAKSQALQVDKLLVGDISKILVETNFVNLQVCEFGDLLFSFIKLGFTSTKLLDLACKEVCKVRNLKLVNSTCVSKMLFSLSQNDDESSGNIELGIQMLGKKSASLCFTGDELVYLLWGLGKLNKFGGKVWNSNSATAVSKNSEMAELICQIRVALTLYNKESSSFQAIWSEHQWSSPPVFGPSSNYLEVVLRSQFGSGLLPKFLLPCGLFVDFFIPGMNAVIEVVEEEEQLISGTVKWKRCLLIKSGYAVKTISWKRFQNLDRLGQTRLVYDLYLEINREQGRLALGMTPLVIPLA